MDVLLIGGSHDGERVEVSDKYQRTLEMLEKRKPSDLSFEKHSRRELKIETYIHGWDGQNPFDPAIFVLDSLTNLDAMSKLYSGYRPRHSQREHEKNG